MAAGASPSSEVEKELTYGIGRVAVAASRMEMAAAVVYAKLLGGGKIAELVAYGQNWTTVSQSCRAILDQLDGTFEDGNVVPRLIATFVRANEAYEQRTKVVHGFWVAATGDGGERFAIVPKRYGKRDVNAWTSAQLDAVCQELSEVGTELLRAGDVLPVIAV